MNLIKRIYRWLIAHPVVTMFGIIVVCSSLASMAHIFFIGLYFNLPLFAVVFTCAMELALVGTTIVYSRKNILAYEQIKDERPWYDRLFKPRKDSPVITARRFATLAIGVFWICVYIMNVSSAYIYLNANFGEFINEEAVWLSDVFFIPIPPKTISIILCHIAAGILPFTAFVFGKMIALETAQQELDERERVIPERRKPGRPKKKVTEPKELEVKPKPPDPVAEPKAQGKPEGATEPPPAMPEEDAGVSSARTFPGHLPTSFKRKNK